MRLALLFIAFCFALSVQSQDDRANPLNSAVAPFSMASVNQGELSFDSFPDAKGFVFVFVCNHCPMAKLYWSRLNEYYQTYLDSDIVFIAINPMDSTVYEEESLSAMRAKVLADKLSIPYVQDGNQSIGKLFNVPHTPHAVILWKENGQWLVKYDGAIDDNGAHPEEATPFLEMALADLRANRSMRLALTQSFGCRVYYRQ